MKNNILFLLKLPPPLTGATLMNAFVFNSLLLNKSYNLKKIGVSYARSVNDLGSFRINKALVFINTFFTLFFKIIGDRPKFIYFQPSILGLTYYRDLIYILLGRLFGIKFLLHLHGKGIAAAAGKSKFVSFLYKLGFSKQYVIVLSKSQESDIAFAQPKQIFVVPNGIQVISGINKENKKEEKFNFLFLSNLLKSKGIYDLLDAAVKLRSRSYNFTINVVGGEGDVTVEELNIYITNNKLNDMVFVHGAKYKDQKNEYFKAADAFIFPTQNEAFGLVVLEAMQFSLPVIATKEGAIPDLIKDETNGFTYNKGDIDILAGKMEFLMNNGETAKQMGANGREIYLNTYTNEHFEKNMKNVFDEVLNKIENE